MQILQGPPSTITQPSLRPLLPALRTLRTLPTLSWEPGLPTANRKNNTLPLGAPPTGNTPLTPETAHWLPWGD